MEDRRPHDPAFKVGYKRPTPDHPNPDPVLIWKEWSGRRRLEAAVYGDDHPFETSIH
jgi:hypothetical protein